VGQPACGKTRHKLDVDDKVEQPAAREDDRVFDERHIWDPATVCTKTRDPSQDCGENAASSEDLKIFPVFPVGDRRQEPGDLGAFDVQQVIDELVAESRT
jgi:hypothetical protein